MVATLLTGAAGQGKTRAAIQQVKQALARKPFGKVWVLLPTDLQIPAFRARLLQEVGDAAYFGVQYFNFNRLYAHLLAVAGLPQRQITESARYRILRHVLSEMGEELAYFGPIALTPGFVAVVAEFIQELKQAQTRPENFALAVRTQKDYELAAIYTAYQDFLRARNLVDTEGEGWLALAQLREKPDLPSGVDLLIVDGYDQFTPVQADLLAQLGSRIRTTLTLTFQPERANTAHRRYAQARDVLLQTGNWTEKPLTSQQADTRLETLAHVSAQLFDTHPQPVPDDGTLVLIEAPDRRREVQTVLKRVKYLLLTGVEPHQIAILSRDLQPYIPYFLDTAPAYGIPLATRHGAPLVENPAVAALLALLDLPDTNFPRRATIDALRSPYLACPYLSNAQIDQLDRISRAQVVVRGRQQWLEAIIAAGQINPDRDDDQSAVVLSPNEAVTLFASVQQFFDRITPPAQATPRDFIRWLESIIGSDDDEERTEDTAPEPVAHFQMIRRIRADAPADLVARDLAALACLKRVFQEVLSAYELIDAWSPVAWETFWLDLRIAINNQTIKPSPTANRSGRVLLASIYEARGLPHNHVFLIGLSEGEFPARTAEDALYTDTERRWLNAQGIPVMTRADSADESSLFYEVTTLARTMLTLTRPYIDDKGNEWPASPYWRAVRAVVDIAPERLPIAAQETIYNAARHSDVMVALAQALNDMPMATTWGVHNWLIDQPECATCWNNVQWGRWIESRRISPHMAHDAYTGHLSDAALLAKINELLGADYVWSASQFNDYGLCPFKFFARRLLKLDVIEEPQEGMDQLQLGSLLHEILEYTYRRIGEERLAITPENQPRALEILESVTDERLADAPQRFGFRAAATWIQEQANLRRKLRKLVMQDFSDKNPLKKLIPGDRYAYRQEVPFGYRQDVTVDGEAGSLRVRGYIDRVDIADGQLVVIDYKSGSTEINHADMLEGRNVQMMLYILAAQQVIPDHDVAGATFWMLGDNKLNGTISADDSRIAEARAALHQRIIKARQGIFVNAPGKLANNGHCSQYCHYGQLCRADRASGHKPIRA
ncbi:MAG: exodeoxyribonuclease V subunit gamma [Anaerolineae bacterium]|nr:exodeoxyribonuclease V subunit gamma [Anaerolineae bacterium]